VPMVIILSGWLWHQHDSEIELFLVVKGGFPVEFRLRDLAALLKQRSGTGGTVKEGRIEIQGDQRERIVAELEKLGYKVKRVGG